MERHRDEIKRLLRNKIRPPEIIQYLKAEGYDSSLSTFKRDMKAIRAESQKWLNDLTKGEFVYTYQLAIESLEERQWKFLQPTTIKEESEMRGVGFEPTNS